MYGKTPIVVSFLVLAAAKEIDVQVGAHGLKFEPEFVTAEKGDVVNFKIYEEHNVAQSDFDSPCKPSGTDAIYSGYKQETFDFAVAVNSSDPVWLYCGTGPHCQLGMVFAINPSSEQTIDMYATKAKDAGMGVNPSIVQGGMAKDANVSQSGEPSSSSHVTGTSPTGPPMPSASSGDAGSLSATISAGLALSLTVMGLFFT